MDKILNSPWFLIAKAALFAAIAGLLQAQSAGQLHLPEWVIPIVAAVYGAAQVGQKRDT